MKTLDIYLAALIAPQRFFGTLAEHKPGMHTPAFFALIGGAISLTLAFLVHFGAHGESGRALFSTLAVLLPLALLFLLACKLAFVHCIATLWGQSGDPGLYWIGQSLAFVPWFLLLPLALLLRVSGLSGFFALGFCVIMGFAWRIELIALGAVYGLRAGRAFLLSILPFALGFAFAVLALLAFVSLVGGLVFAALGFAL
ncbi:MAG: hypothetical protein LBC99_01520 [Spirochaetota bacterium]|jgi:hypothetical protein|nr:hypothetical protein [Spirochaetota bacterium]